jgi:polyphosphate kinase
MLRIPKDLADPKLYLNRELSQLEFNRRVLEQAKDPGTPLLEQLRFLTIASSNMDEFFEIRVAGLKQQIVYGIEQVGPDGLTAAETLRRVSQTAHALVEEQYRLLNQELLPALAREGIQLLRRADWTEKQRRWIRRYFSAEVLPVLTPMGIDPAHPFPRVLNKGLSFLVTLDGTDAFGRDSGIAVVQVPRSLPRLIRLPANLGAGENAFLMLSSVIHAQVSELFPGMEVADCHQFRVTRNSDLWVDEEDVDNLLQAVKGELPGRKYGDAVRLEVAQGCSDELTRMLLRNVGLGTEDLYRVDGPVNLNRLAAIYEGVQRPELKHAPFVPGVRKRLRAKDLFEVIRKGDVVLHHPFESFTPVVQLLQQAAADPHVLAIKITVYRTDADSPLVAALLEAALAGKEVTAVIELRARFDEAANIDIATRLQEAGANVVYGVVGYKAHAKMILIVRREGRRLRRYVHLGTGNYHAGTARAYTDIGFLTCSAETAQDVHKVFQDLTGLGRAGRLQELLQSPFTLRKQLLERIEFETREAEHGRLGRIVARMNALSEPGIIRALYRASQAGVTIDLVVRGICCLRPGVPGVSENIGVRSIVGRFLEHSRVFWFQNGGEGVLYASSADWMARNLFSRVEIAFPIRDERLRERVFEECLELQLADNAQAWVLQPDGSYQRARPGKRRPIVSQSVLLQILSEDAGDTLPSSTFHAAERRRRESAAARSVEDARSEPDEEPADAEPTAAPEPDEPADEDEPPRRLARG